MYQKAGRAGRSVRLAGRGEFPLDLGTVGSLYRDDCSARRAELGAAPLCAALASVLLVVGLALGHTARRRAGAAAREEAEDRVLTV